MKIRNGLHLLILLIFGILLIQCGVAPFTDQVIEELEFTDTRYIYLSFTPSSGTFDHDITVEINCSDVDADIHYTTDGSNPDVSSALYTAPVPVQGHGTSVIIKAIAVIGGRSVTGISSAAFTLDYNKVSTPQFSITEGVYDHDLDIEISCSSENTVIYYTDDGTTPTTSSPQYLAPISVSGNGTVKIIKAIAVKSGYLESTVSISAYQISYPAVANVQFSLADGTYSTNQTVTLSSATPGAHIIYTTDGSEPSQSNGFEFSAPLSVTSSVTIKAIAWKEGMMTTPVSVAHYRLQVQPPAISPSSGGYLNPKSISISSPDPSAQVRYTIDGYDPTDTSGTLYTGSFSLSTPGYHVIRSVAYKNGYEVSLLSSATIYIKPAVRIRPGSYLAIGPSISKYNSNLYIAFDGANGYEIAESSNGGTTWSYLSIDSDVDEYSKNTMTVDSTGIRYIAYCKNSTRDLKLCRVPQGQNPWNFLITVDSTGDVGYNPSIKIGSNGYLYIAYTDESNQTIKLAQSSDGGDTWVFKVVDTTSVQYSSLDMSCQLNGDIYLAYCYNNSLRVAKSVDGGSTWSYSDVPKPSSTNYVTDVNIRIDNNIIYVSTSRTYTYGNGSQYERLYLSKSADDGATWTTSMIQDNAGAYNILQVSNGVLYIIYCDGTRWHAVDQHIRLAKSIDNGSTWTLSTIDAYGDSGYLISLLVEDDDLYVSYSNDIDPYGSTYLLFMKSLDGGVSWY